MGRLGLLAENYAIKAGVSPQESMGMLSLTIVLKIVLWVERRLEERDKYCEPEYYKWTQWIFVKMHENGFGISDSRWQMVVYEVSDSWLMSR